MITVTRDPRTREIQIRGPDGFVDSLEDQVITQGAIPSIQRVLNATYEAGKEAAHATYRVGVVAP